jgi:two-component system, chemotaxis family, response regulator WspF
MKIGIVNELPVVIEALRRAVSLTEHQVIWFATDGARAVDLCAKQTPDLVLIDVMMSAMDGVEVTRRIMARTPCAVLIVTSDVGLNSARVFEAMGHGALNAVDAPALGTVDWLANAAPLLAKIETIAELLDDKRIHDADLSNALVKRSDRLVAIGASAGGPAALATILGGLSKEFPAAIVIIQHIDEQFAANMASWLSQFSPWPVRVALEGECPSVGSVLLAGTNDHLVLKATDRLGYTAEPRDQAYRPSVDVFFQSIALYWSGEVVGVLLTGMGRDGAVGLRDLRSKGCYTIAQDEASCAVYGMPKAAAMLGAAVDILPLEFIAQRLNNFFSHALTNGE